MNWENIDLNSHEIYANIVDSYSFNTLLLEVTCNCKEINKETIRKQFEESLNSNIQSAREVFESNLDNILNHALKYRQMK